MSLFAPAVKAQLRARVALCGPTGSGKTWTALEWAEVLADGGRIALVDTERGSASLYAHRFTFDVLRWEPPYEPNKLVEVLRAAAADGYTVVVVDSLSHFWEGEGGTLDIADAAGQRAQGNSFAGWKVATPTQRHMVDTIVGLDAHVIVTMRSKMEYALEEYEDGKGRKRSKPVKLGLAPVQRAGVEYEFTVVGDLDLEHRIVISKSRCDVLADQVVQPGRAKDAAKTFFAWLNDGEPLADRDAVEKLVGLLGQIADEGARVAAKRMFIDRFGRPDTLRAGQLDEARAFVEEVAAAADAPGAGEVPPAGSNRSTTEPNVEGGAPRPDPCPTCALEGGAHEDGCPEAGA